MYAIVENNSVINIIIWDGQGDWSPEKGQVIEIPNGQKVKIGDEYKMGVFVSKEEPIESSST